MFNMFVNTLVNTIAADGVNLLRVTCGAKRREGGSIFSKWNHIFYSNTFL